MFDWNPSKQLCCSLSLFSLKSYVLEKKCTRNHRPRHWIYINISVSININFNILWGSFQT